MDPISISSGIAGLLSLAITVAEKSYQYYASAVRSASASIASYLQELSALKMFYSASTSWPKPMMQQLDSRKPVPPCF
jgi:hypothetical protein